MRFAFVVHALLLIAPKGDCTGPRQRHRDLDAAHAEAHERADLGSDALGQACVAFIGLRERRANWEMCVPSIRETGTAI